MTPCTSARRDVRHRVRRDKAEAVLHGVQERQERVRLVTDARHDFVDDFLDDFLDRIAIRIWMAVAGMPCAHHDPLKSLYHDSNSADTNH